ncbi:MAG TPA: LuxR C-terminal-related transcriptional regulator [Gemmataceae bacterium]|nr:LuxR C-terminal-related transcriptional regulator [Gemmataceae bacterium]
MSQTTGYGRDAGAAEAASLRLNGKEWFARLGEVAKSIGSGEFHRELIDLYGSSIQHESTWIIHFSRAAPPEVIYTHNVPEEVVGTYNSTFAQVDPFSHYWKHHPRPGVLPLSQAKTQSREAKIYSELFLPRAHISDEMAIMLPTVGQCCFGLFLERESGHFSRADVERAQTIFPALEGCHRAHVGWIFNDLGNVKRAKAQPYVDKPMLILDRFGSEVYSNDAWNDAVAADNALMPLVRGLLPVSGTQTRLVDNFVLSFEALDRSFPLAPGGRMFVLEPRATAVDFETVNREANLLDMFTRRERDILNLIMNCRSTGQIAQQLQISKGTVKNYRLRIYRKADVVSERELVKKFAPLFR